MSNLNKQYLIATVTINLFCYAFILLSTVFRFGDKFLLLHPVVIFNILFIIDFFGAIIGRRILKSNPADKYARIGFIINITLILGLFLMWTFTISPFNVSF
ncbi:MAG: hypothetical protein US45_C0022G0003 [Candidatus Nomurabacteria bacterium GW2011_GWA1_37_20]|uniref:Uncharacterized protein n=1 Tax=Candidatus Nomurabacteria bacterium GW2011_GWA1_37_20 TaxID=1618729 RepID=A0A0G0J702_9BACT|nr:MAG: hypothetical protein US45_C0022G0003 [Candidatus Nomurabacteria bacterium GW2011_GWA1_37_20]